MKNNVDGRELRKFHTSEMESLQLVSTSKGNQRKWIAHTQNTTLWVKEQFEYQGRLWKDYLVEVIASKIAKQINLNGVSVVDQEECKIINDDTGCITYGSYSPGFCKNNYFVSYERILKNSGNEFRFSWSMEQRWYSILDTMKKITGHDFTNYFIVMSLLDYLVGNEDRHFNNFGMMSDFTMAPLFDFGLGLFEHDLRYEGLSFRECLDKMESKPFDPDNQKVVDFLLAEYDIAGFLPDSIDLTGIKIPSAKAGSYLRNRCMKLGIGLKGVD